MINNQLKNGVHDIYEKDEKLTIIFEPSVDGDSINKTYLDKKFLKMNGH